jgi:hypothetical protein
VGAPRGGGHEGGGDRRQRARIAVPPDVVHGQHARERPGHRPEVRRRVQQVDTRPRRRTGDQGQLAGGPARSRLRPDGQPDDPVDPFDTRAVAAHEACHPQARVRAPQRR